MSSKAVQLIETGACRICLDENSRMSPITNNELKQTWQKLADIKPNTDAGQQLMVCYLCHAHLQRCAQLRKRALRTEALLMEMITDGEEVTQKFMESIDRRRNNLHYNYKTSATEFWECSNMQNKVLDNIKVEVNVELERLSPDMAVKEEAEENFSVHTLEEDVMSYEIKGDTYITEEEYVIPESAASVSDEMLCENIKNESTVYRINNTNQETTKPVNAPIIPEDITCQENGFHYGVTRQEMDFRKPNLPSDEIKVYQCNLCSNISKCEMCVTCRPKDSDEPSQCAHNSHDEPRNSVFSDFECVKTCHLSEDIQTHTLRKPFTCEICNSKYSLQSSLKRHIASKHTKEMKYSCDICQFQCVLINEMNRHKQRHTGEKPFHCEICQCKLSSKCSLQTHMKYKHMKEKKFSCDLCPYQCVVIKDLNRHIQKHTGGKSFSCDLCKCTFSYKASLNLHIKSKHTQVKNFSCDICHYQCVNKGDFTVHMRKHTGEKPYVCDICNARFYRQSTLWSHMKYKHAKEKNMSCDICHYQCVRKRDLNVHMRKHTGEKPFSCILCDRRFSVKGNLKMHMKTKHTKGENVS